MDLWIVLAKCFSSWTSIQALMSFLIVWCIILLALSGWMTSNDGGSLSSLHVNGQQPYKQWGSSVCNSSPYMYIKPFSFGYTGSKTSSNPSFCSFPTTNSDFRLCIGVFCIVSVAALFFHTPLSFLARPIFLIFGLFFFAAAVLDINAVVVGLSACNSKFPNTQLHQDLSSLGLTPSCDSSNYDVMCVVDLIVSAQLLFLYTAWLFCKDKYVRKPGQHSQEEKALLKANT